MSNIIGRWDLTVNGEYPSWVEINGAESRFVGRFGSSRPITTVDFDGDSVRWQLPRQYESREDDLAFEGRLEGDQLTGTTTLDDGTTANWTGKRAPELPYKEPTWGETVSLIGEDLSNWHLRSPEWKSHWRIVDGMLYNDEVGSDLVSNHPLMDFKLVAEYKYPAGSNSGIYLRGRYEVQILDDHGHAPGVGTSGAIYGFIAPSEQAVLPPDEWNTVEITFIGRFVTIVLNGKTVIDQQEIPGITGGALDSNEGAPGTLFLQGDHGPIVFRRLDVTITEG